jgi:spermidine synthase
MRAAAESTPHVIRIGEDGGRAALLVDGVVQSISPEDGLTSGGYWSAMVTGLRPTRALILGLGGGTLARLLQARWGDLRIVGVDDEDAVLAVAREAGWLPHEGLEVVVRDAFDYVQGCDERFDYIAVDLFRGQRMPRRVFGKPFLRRVRSMLEPNGQLVINMFCDKRELDRVNRVTAFFDVRARVIVGGNVVIHARRRRGT